MTFLSGIKRCATKVRTYCNTDKMGMMSYRDIKRCATKVRTYCNTD